MPTERTCSNQSGQSSAEYAVVVAALVGAMLFPLSSVNCPTTADCNVLEQLANVLRERNQGYSYAISVDIPDPLVTPGTILPEWLDQDDPGDGDVGEADDGDFTYTPEGPAVDGGRVAISGDKVLGKVSADGRLLNDDGSMVGMAVGDLVYEVDGAGNIAVDPDTGLEIEIGTAHLVNEDGILEGTGRTLDDFEY